MSRPPRAALVSFVFASLALAAFPVATHFRLSAAERAEQVRLTVTGWPHPVEVAGSRNKDYGLWYPVGLVARSERNLYPTPADVGTDGEPVPFPFMYPPFAGAVLAWISHLGQTGMLLTLVLANLAVWAFAVWLSVRLAGPSSGLVWWLPSVLCLFFVYDMFLLGQPNLGLLVLMLVGFHALRAGRQGWAGVAFAVAAAIKAFPAVVLVYLLWRRYWSAAICMVALTAGLLLLAPVPTRGWDQNLHDLRLWADGMLFKNDGGKVGQRPQQSQSWRNQSLLGVGQRLVSRVDAEADSFGEAPPLYVNLLDLDHTGARLVVATACLALGLGFAAVLPRPATRTRTTDAAEFALLTVLIVVGTPYAFVYYFVWLLFPATVLVGFATTDPSPIVRRTTWATLGLGFGLMLAGAPLTDNKVPAAIGAFLWGALVLAGGLGWHLWRLGRGLMPAAG